MDNDVMRPHRSASFLGLTLAIGLLFLGCASLYPAPEEGAEDRLVFAVFGDTRSDVKCFPICTGEDCDPSTCENCDPCTPESPTTPPKGHQWSDYFNKKTLTTTINAVTNQTPNPDFSIFMGDIGRHGGKGVFDAFKSIAQPLVDDSIPLHMVVGNHELEDPCVCDGWDNGTSLSSAQEAYLDAFVSTADPDWAPGANLTTANQGTAYAFRQANNLFIVLNSFYVQKNSDCNLWQKGYYSAEQLVWFQGVLKANPKTSAADSVDNIFVFSHMPVFDAYDGSSTESPAHLYNEYDDRTACQRPKKAGKNTNWVLWALMDYYEVDVFFGAHQHFYHRWIVPTKTDLFQSEYKEWTDDATLSNDFKALLGSYPGEAGWKTEIPHVVIGTSGAAAPPLTEGSWDSCDAHNTNCTSPGCSCEKAYSYAMIEVNGTEIDITTYTMAPPETVYSEHEHLQKKDGTWGKPGTR